MLLTSTLNLQKHTILISSNKYFLLHLFLFKYINKFQLSSYLFVYKFPSIRLFRGFWKSSRRLSNDDWIFFLRFNCFNDIMDFFNLNHHVSYLFQVWVLISWQRTQILIFTFIPSLGVYKFYFTYSFFTFFNLHMLMVGTLQELEYSKSVI